MGIFILFQIFNVILGIAILVYYVKNFRAVNQYIKYGIVIALTMTLFEFIGSEFSIANGFLVLLSMLKTAIYTSLGIHLCQQLGLRDLPLIKKLFGEWELDEINPKAYLLSTTGVILGSSLFSIILFKLTSPTASEAVKNLLDWDAVLQQPNTMPSLTLIILIMAVVIAEEVTFRLVIQNYLVKQFKLENKYWIPIVLSSLMWTLAHGNTLIPEWVKFAQIFPIGLALGALYKKFGLESVIIAHGGFNIIMMFLSGNLIRM